MDKGVFGSRLREARKTKGFSQSQLAELVNDSLTQSLVAKYEKGLSAPYQDRLLRLCKILNVSEPWLRGLTDVNDADFSAGNEDQLQSENAKLRAESLKWREKYLETREQLLELRESLLLKNDVPTSDTF